MITKHYLGGSYAADHFTNKAHDYFHLSEVEMLSFEGLSHPAGTTVENGAC